MHEREDLESSELTMRTKRRIICLAMDTVDRLKKVGNTAEASWVERFLNTVCDNLNLDLFFTLELSRQRSPRHHGA